MKEGDYPYAPAKPPIPDADLRPAATAEFAAYMSTIVQRDVRGIARIENVTDIPRLLSVLAARAGAILNVADLSRTLALPHTTLTRHLSLLEATFLLVRVPAWAAGRRVRALKAPRVFVTDTGLLAHLAGLDEARLAVDATAAGPLLENVVAMELTRQLGWSRIRASLHHFRTYTGIFRKDISLAVVVFCRSD